MMRMKMSNMAKWEVGYSMCGRKVRFDYLICEKCGKIIPTLQNGVIWDMNHPSICKCKVKHPKIPKMKQTPTDTLTIIDVLIVIVIILLIILAGFIVLNGMRLRPDLLLNITETLG